MTDRVCEQCGSADLQMVKVGDGYWRKECADCGSTGAFVIEPVGEADDE